ncbi:MAG: helix-turn-helix transcriptional regulator [Dehalococcoidia bacterium]|nr:helix-turn-helix transcriptional regulator [Dehalococcoidia bacterium]
MTNEKEVNLEDHIRERETSDAAFRASRARHRERYEYTRKLIEARLACKLTQEELARALGTTQSSVARLESGRFLPRADTLRRLADVLGVEIRIGPNGRIGIEPVASLQNTP